MSRNLKSRSLAPVSRASIPSIDGSPQLLSVPKMAKISQKTFPESFIEIKFEHHGLTKTLKLSSNDLLELDVAWLNKQYSSWVNSQKEKPIDDAHVILTSNLKNDLLIEYLLTKPKAKLSFLPYKVSIRNWEVKTISQMESYYKNKSFDYEDVQLIGRGGFSEVFRARKKTNGQFVAVKRIEKGRLGGENLEKNLILEERSTMLKLRGHFLANLVRAFQTNKHFYFEIEYMACGSLRQLIDKSRALKESEIRHIICEIIVAMEFIHKAGYIIRDLKSDNILLDENGHTYLCDMGLAGKGPKDGELLRGCCGTMEYMAPETVARKGYDYCADYYSLGIIAFELSEGLPPFCRQSRNDNISSRILNEVPVIKSDRSPEFIDFVNSILIKDPKSRLGSEYGIIEIMAHSWLNEVDFNSYRKRKNVTPISILQLLSYCPKISSSSSYPKNNQRLNCPDKSITHLTGFSVDTLESGLSIEDLDEEIFGDVNMKLSKVATRSQKNSWSSTRADSGATFAGRKTSYNSSLGDDATNECNATFSPKDLNPEINACLYYIPKGNMEILQKPDSGFKLK